MTPHDRAARISLALSLLALSWVIFASAWLSDDAWITLRSVDNFLAGHGLRWNPVERVQSFTHPAWALILTAAIGVSGEVTFTVLAVSLACSAGAVALLVRRIALTPLLAALGIVALLASKAFVDYSTSGLENPLTHLLLAGFLAVWFARADDDAGQRRLLWLSLIAACLAVNRLDSALLVGPAVGAAALARGRAGWRALALGSLPFIAWECFALAYYGFPFPNTAYAKLATGIPAGELFQQGLYYLGDSAVRDPATLVTLLTGCGLAAWRVPGARPVVLGVVIYLAYVVRVGGDFMSGRFLAAPLFCAIALLCRWPAAERRLTPRLAAACGASLIALSLLGQRPPLTSGVDYGVGWAPDEGRHGIVDERAGYYPVTGLWRMWSAGANPLQHPWAATGSRDRRRPEPVLLAGPVGLYGFSVGPDKIIVDEFALADPLRARLPVAAAAEWRIGHFPRPVPAGYFETLATGNNQLADPTLAALWDDLSLVTRGALFTSERWRAIARLNAMTLPVQTPSAESER